MTKLVSRIRRRLIPSFLLPAAFAVWRNVRDWSPRSVLRNWKARREAALPIPPGALIFSSTGTRDVSWFLKSGEMTAESFRNALNELGRPIESFNAILDLGCGCGRVLRQWAQVRGPRFFGTDYNPAGVRWGAANLAHVIYGTNALEPPLSYANGAFDLVYAVSVFTHLPADLQRPWIEELHRIITPGGVLLLTLSGSGDAERITSEEQRSFNDGNLVVVDAKFAGTNMCSAYHPESWVRRSWSDLFRIARMYPEGAKGSPRQDLYVFERVG